MGTVFEGVQENPRRSVAIKVIKGGDSSEKAVSRLKYEAQMLARLHHPGIAEIYEAGTFDDRGVDVPYFAMEYIPNARTLTEYANYRKLSVEERLRLFVQVCDAVNSGHQKGVVHRDLKPDNILVDSYDRVRVIDFGLARATDSDLRQTQVQTEVGQIVGSLYYMSPEQFEEDSNDLDTRSDVYSLGAILFHLLTGTALPSSAADRGAALEAAHLAWDGEALPSDIQSILCRALAPVPTDRYESASAFRAELEHLLYGGAYSPTTFNLALFMDRLFRAEIEADDIAAETESEIDFSAYFTPVATKTEAEVPISATETTTPEAVPPEIKRGSKGVVWAIVAAVAVIGIAAVIFWIGRKSGPQEPPPTPTPTAAEIAAQRQAQDDRLRTLTQEMVQQLMIEREEEIRQELIARQTRIEELQKRLQQSERRAKTSAVAAAKEAETQKELMKEIEVQEEAQRAQEEALESERQEALESASQEAVDATGAGSVLAADVIPPSGDSQKSKTVKPPLPTPTSPTPTRPPEPTEAPVVTAVEIGQFFPPSEVDTMPVVIKSQPLEWPRRAARSRGKGVVVVQLTVNASGGVDEVEVLRADHTGWGIPETVMDAASGYRFKPGMKNGVAITTYAFATWRYDFTGE